MQANDAFALLRGNGQPWLFVVQAVEIASSADMVLELMRYTVYGETPPRPVPPRPLLQQWTPMYRRHRSMQDRIAAGMILPPNLSASEGLDELRAVSQMSCDEIAAEVKTLSREEQENFLRLFVGVPFPPDLATLRMMLAGIDADTTPDDPELEGNFDSLMGSPAGQFYFRVWMPCWVLYRELPPRLMRAARLDDLDALDRLLRLDKFAVGDPGIARRVAEVMSEGTAGDKRRIEQALSGRPTVRITPKAIRAGLGALISQFATLFGCRVTAPQIQDLFDRIERIRSGNPADPHVPAGEALTKALKRHKNWPGMPID